MMEKSGHEHPTGHVLSGAFSDTGVITMQDACLLAFFFFFLKRTFVVKSEETSVLETRVPPLELLFLLAEPR